MLDNMQIIIILILIFSVIIHEISHGLMAYFQGDDAAERAGRITLNPIPHIDLFGTIILPLIFILFHVNGFIAWAKPVPYNPNNLKNKKWGEFLVAVAGPLSNIVLMVIFLIFFILLVKFNITSNEFILKVLFNAAFLNWFLAIFNLIPIVPLDGSKILFSLLPFKLSQKVRSFMEKNYFYIFLIFLIIIFNTSFIIDWISTMYFYIFELIT